MESRWIEVQLQRRRPLADGVVGLELAALPGVELPPFAAGAHIDLQLPDGLVRQYSLCGDPACREVYELGVLLAPDGRGGSRQVHELLQEGQRLRISAPRNLFPLAPAPHSLLMAGGIGITPLLCMAQQLWAEDASFELHYCARSPGRAAFLDRLGSQRYADRVHLHFDEGPASQHLDLFQVLGRQSAQTHLYVCGPRGYMDFVLATSRGAGWDEERLHSECFSPVATDGGTGRPFSVRLAGSDRVMPVQPGQSVVDALKVYGIEVPVSCEQGICGTCAMRVVEGEVEHRDMYFSDAERLANGLFTPCCSRAHSPLIVIDFV